jgi:actin related protein 2/3 complex subunit 3
LGQNGQSVVGFAVPHFTQKSSIALGTTTILARLFTVGIENGDIIDEAIVLFRPNAYFRTFEMRGPADRTLAYLLLFIGDALGKLKAGMTQSEAQKHLGLWASSSFSIPGDSSFSLKAMFPEPKTRQEADQLREYLVKLRVETVGRFLSVLYAEDKSSPSQWWMAFQKRKFMGKTLG